MSRPTIGEGKALICTMVDLSPDDLIGYVVIGVTAEGPRVAHSVASKTQAWPLVGILSSVIEIIAAAEEVI